MARIAIYGSSHVKRLSKYFQTRPFLFKMKHFCRGGMRADEVNNQSWKDMLKYKPTHVFIHVGGNDITSTSETDDIFLPIKALVQELWLRNVVVIVGEVMPRLDFRDRALTHDVYEQKRKSLNDKLRRFMRKNFRMIYVQSLFHGRPHRDLDEDLVHLSDYGQKKYSMALYRAFMRVLYKAMDCSNLLNAK